MNSAQPSSLHWNFKVSREVAAGAFGGTEFQGQIALDSLAVTELGGWGRGVVREMGEGNSWGGGQSVWDVSPAILAKSKDSLPCAVAS